MRNVGGRGRSSDRSHGRFELTWGLVSFSLSSVLRAPPPPSYVWVLEQLCCSVSVAFLTPKIYVIYHRKFETIPLGILPPPMRITASPNSCEDDMRSRKTAFIGVLLRGVGKHSCYRRKKSQISSFLDVGGIVGHTLRAGWYIKIKYALELQPLSSE
jgi:hypothetical protein